MSLNSQKSVVISKLLVFLFYILCIQCYKLNAEYDSDYEPDPVCAEHPDSGVGPKLIHHWYFNVELAQCREIVYRGHGGNGNRFKSQYDCEHKCMRQFIEGAQDSGPKIKAPVSHRMKESKKHLSYRVIQLDKGGKRAGSHSPGKGHKRRHQRRQRRPSREEDTED